jgi:hypothetical protein
MVAPPADLRHGFCADRPLEADPPVRVVVMSDVCSVRICSWITRQQEVGRRGQVDEKRSRQGSQKSPGGSGNLPEGRLGPVYESTTLGHVVGVRMFRRVWFDGGGRAFEAPAPACRSVDIHIQVGRQDLPEHGRYIRRFRLCRGFGHQQSSLEQPDTAYQIAESWILADRIEVRILTKIDHVA